MSCCFWLGGLLGCFTGMLFMLLMMELGGWMRTEAEWRAECSERYRKSRLPDG